MTEVSKQRLNATLRNQIRKAVLMHRFQSEVKALVAEGRSVMRAIWEHFFTAEELERMNALPQGWLQTSNYINFVFQGQQHYDTFDGVPNHYGWRDSDLGVWKFMKQVGNELGEVPEVRCPYDFPGNTLKDSALITRYEKLLAARQEFQDKYKEAYLALTNALQRHAACHKLAEAWPELVPFLPKASDPAVVVKSNLPAIPVAKLNEMFGLPV